MRFLLSRVAVSLSATTILTHHRRRGFATALSFVVPPNPSSSSSSRTHNPRRMPFPASSHTMHRPVVGPPPMSRYRFRLRSTTAGDEVADDVAAASDDDDDDDAAMLGEVRSMKVSTIKSELESLGISTKSFFEKGELVDALVDARKTWT